MNIPMKHDVRWREVAFVFLGSQILASPILVGGLMSRGQDIWISYDTLAGTIAVIAVAAWFGLIPGRRMVDARKRRANLASSHDVVIRVHGVSAQLTAAIAARDLRQLATELYFLRRDDGVAELPLISRSDRTPWHLRRAIQNLLRAIDNVVQSASWAATGSDPARLDWAQIEAAGEKLNRAAGEALRRVQLSCEIGVAPAVHKATMAALDREVHDEFCALPAGFGYR